MSAFAALHPAVSVLYFAFTLVLTMLLRHPLLQLLGLLLPMSLCLACFGRTYLLRRLKGLLPLMLFAALLNPLLSQEGSSVLFFFPWGKPCTLEALLYGLCLALRLASILLLFAVFQYVITTDKFVFLFGRWLPSLALTVCMGLRLVPQLLKRLRQTAEVQKCLHPEQKGLRLVARAVSITVTWALENAIDTADSMKSRGYGLPGRSHFSVFRFGLRDTGALLALLFLGIGSSVLLALGAAQWEFYPQIVGKTDGFCLLAAAFYSGLCAFPLVYEGKELLLWRASS